MPANATRVESAPVASWESESSAFDASPQEAFGEGNPCIRQKDVVPDPSLRADAPEGCPKSGRISAAASGSSPLVPPGAAHGPLRQVPCRLRGLWPRRPRSTNRAERYFPRRGIADSLR